MAFVAKFYDMKIMYLYYIFVNISIIHFQKYILISTDRIHPQISSNFILSLYHPLKLKEVRFFR